MEQHYGYAVMFVDGEEMGDYVGYFQTDLKDAKSVAGEILYNHDEEAGAVGIYELVLVETVDPPKDEDEDGPPICVCLAPDLFCEVHNQ